MLALASLPACFGAVPERPFPDEVPSLDTQPGMEPCGGGVVRSSTRRLQYHVGPGLLTSRPGQVAWFSPIEPLLRVFSSLPEVEPVLDVRVRDWPRSHVALELFPTDSGYAVLASSRSSTDGGFALMHLEGESIARVEPVTYPSGVGPLVFGPAGGWIGVKEDQNGQKAVYSSSAAEPLYRLPSRARAIVLAWPDVTSFLEGDDGRVYAGERPLELPKCQWPLRALPPSVAVVPDGLIVVQSCFTGVRISRFGSSTRPERTVELPGEVAMVSIALDGAGRLAVVRSPERPEKPSFTLLRLEDLTEAWSPLRLEHLEGCFSEPAARIVVDPSSRERFGVQLFKPTGHGSGCTSLTRLQFCYPE